mmetsp:Transcript_13316/g.39514  ORF Transcript_13316/g.39514 Transcript_13316/m.39514 type:complete len:413 (-) Transcript_13316:1070-2308(-)
MLRGQRDGSVPEQVAVAHIPAKRVAPRVELAARGERTAVERARAQLPQRHARQPLPRPQRVRVTGLAKDAHREDLRRAPLRRAGGRVVGRAGGRGGGRRGRATRGKALCGERARRDGEEPEANCYLRHRCRGRRRAAEAEDPPRPHDEPLALQQLAALLGRDARRDALDREGGAKDPEVTSVRDGRRREAAPLGALVVVPRRGGRQRGDAAQLGDAHRLRHRVPVRQPAPAPVPDRAVHPEGQGRVVGASERAGLVHAREGEQPWHAAAARDARHVRRTPRVHDDVGLPGGVSGDRAPPLAHERQAAEAVEGEQREDVVQHVVVERRVATRLERHESEQATGLRNLVRRRVPHRLRHPPPHLPRLRLVERGGDGGLEVVAPRHRREQRGADLPGRRVGQAEPPLRERLGKRR